MDIVDGAVDAMQLTVKALQGRECSLQVKSPRRLLHSPTPAAGGRGRVGEAGRANLRRGCEGFTAQEIRAEPLPLHLGRIRWRRTS